MYRERTKKSGHPVSFAYFVAMVLVLVLLGGCGDARTQIVAEVNGEEITRAEFSQVMDRYKAQYLMQGIDLDSEDKADTLKELEHQVLNAYFIYAVLLKQEAEKEGMVVTEAQIEERYQEYLDAFGGEEELKEQLKASGMSPEDLDKEIVRDVYVSSYLEMYKKQYLEQHPEERIDEDIEVSVDDVEARYEQLIDYYEGLKEMLEQDDPGVPVSQLEEQVRQLQEQYGLSGGNNSQQAKLQIEEEIRRNQVTQERQDKENRIVMQHIEELKTAADIVVYL